MTATINNSPYRFMSRVTRNYPPFRISYLVYEKQVGDKRYKYYYTTIKDLWFDTVHIELNNEQIRCILAEKVLSKLPFNHPMQMKIATIQLLHNL
jgi:hypothetical protein